MEKDFDHELEVSAIKLQKQVYNLACLAKTEEHQELHKRIEIKYKIKDALEAINHLNLEFNKNYETSLEHIISHYKCPLTKEVGKCVCPNYADIEAILEKVAL